MTNEEMVYYLEHADITVGQKNKTKTAEAIEKALKIIEEKSKRGKWIIVDDCEHFIAKCDRCGNVIDSRLLAWHPEKYAYCSSCGADMREVSADGDSD